MKAPIQRFDRLGERFEEQTHRYRRRGFRTLVEAAERFRARIGKRRPYLGGGASSNGNQVVVISGIHYLF
ncbi:hypothetical protein [Paraburkholderia sp. J12]|uniref:hypothetical protein n=1 Tax=Paraburkholderia sp. J12 TaxID=2805432 RepID=UPI002ABDCCAD|nr:hypothetical protein [Paraburkholderia sp. J12]